MINSTQGCFVIYTASCLTMNELNLVLKILLIIISSCNIIMLIKILSLFDFHMTIKIRNLSIAFGNS